MIRAESFERLMEVKKYPAISIYIPTQRVGDNRADIIRFKNELREMEIQLTARGLTGSDLEGFLNPLTELIEQDSFWLDLSDGLAVFRSADKFEIFKVPTSFTAFSHLGDQFYLNPLGNCLDKNRLFYILALSQNETRFFECTMNSVTPILIHDEIPPSLEDSLQMSGEKNLQGHKAGSMVIHGHGKGNDENIVRLEQYCRNINEGVNKIILKVDGPLVVACVDSLFPIYQKENSYPRLYDKNISGNVENDDPVLLHEKAISVLNDWIEKPGKKASEKFEISLANDKASFSNDTIIPAAIAGRIDTLFLTKGIQSWGNYDSKSHKIHIHPERTSESECLIERAYREVYKAGGEVYLMDRTSMPRPTANMNAVLRY